MDKSSRVVATGRGMRGSVWQGFVLFGIWVLLSGKMDPFHLGLGVLSTVVVLLLNARLRRTALDSQTTTDWQRVRPIQVLRFAPWLLWQMIVANVQVLILVLTPSLPIEPAVLRFRVRFSCTAAKIILGHSITLTPGTLTLQIEEDRFVVHALTHQSFATLIDGSLATGVARLFEPDPQNVIYDFEILKTNRTDP